jgi:hypothetical protein
VGHSRLEWECPNGLPKCPHWVSDDPRPQYMILISSTFTAEIVLSLSPSDCSAAIFPRYFDGTRMRWYYAPLRRSVLFQIISMGKKPGSPAEGHSITLNWVIVLRSNARQRLLGPHPEHSNNAPKRIPSKRGIGVGDCGGRPDVASSCVTFGSRERAQSRCYRPPWTTMRQPSSHL